MLKKLIVKLIRDKLISPRSERMERLRRTMIVYAVIFIVWGLYRLLVRFPVALEEVFLKPVVFLLPIIWTLRFEKLTWSQMFSALGFRKKNVFYSMYLGLTLGLVYMIASVLSGLLFSQRNMFFKIELSEAQIVGAVGISLATALWEQIAFSGFFLQRFEKLTRNEWQSVLLTAILFTLLHLPILWLDLGVNVALIMVQLLLIALIGFGNSVLMLRSENIMAPILSHVFWAMTFKLLVSFAFY